MLIQGTIVTKLIPLSRDRFCSLSRVQLSCGERTTCFAYIKIPSTGCSLGGRSVSPISSLNSISTLRQIAVIGISFIPLSKGFSLASHVIKFVQEEVNNPSLHHGIMFQLKTEVEYRAVAFCSGEHQYPQLHPELEVNYEVK